MIVFQIKGQSHRLSTLKGKEKHVIVLSGLQETTLIIQKGLSLFFDPVNLDQNVSSSICICICLIYRPTFSYKNVLELYKKWNCQIYPQRCNTFKTGRLKIKVDEINNNNNNNLRLLNCSQTAQSYSINIRHAGRDTTAATQVSTIYRKVKPAKLLPHTAHSDWINRTGLTSWAFTRWCDRHTSDKVAHYSIYRPQKDERLSWPWTVNRLTFSTVTWQ